MKAQATAVLTFQAKTLAEAGVVPDDVLGGAREPDHVDVGCIKLCCPPGDRIVTLSRVAPAGYATHIPSSTGGGSANGS
jgi:hypothetical protein